MLLNIDKGNLKLENTSVLKPYRDLIRKVIADTSKTIISVKVKRRMMATDKGVKLLALLHKPVLRHFQYLNSTIHDSPKINLLKHFQTFNPILKKLFILHIDASFIKFITEILLNIVEGNMRVQSKASLESHSGLFAQILTDNRKTDYAKREKRLLLGSRKGLNLLAMIYEPLLLHFSHLNHSISRVWSA